MFRDVFTFLIPDLITVKGKRVIIYCTETCLKALERSTTSFTDGTFQTSPMHFAQTFILRAMIDDIYVPIAFCFLEDEKYCSYKLALETLREAAPRWDPRRVVSDFERGELKAIREVFPNLEWLQGCHFHYCQCQLKRYKKAEGYNSDVELRDVLIKTIALPLLPPDDVQKGWKLIRSALLPAYPAAERYVDYLSQPG